MAKRKKRNGVPLGLLKWQQEMAAKRTAVARAAKERKSRESRFKESKLGGLLKGRFTSIEDVKAELFLKNERKRALRKAQEANINKYAEEKAKLLRKEKLSKISDRIKSRQIKRLSKARARAFRDAKNIHSPMGFGEALGFSRPVRKKTRRGRTSQDDFY